MEAEPSAGHAAFLIKLASVLRCTPVPYNLVTLSMSKGAARRSPLAYAGAVEGEGGL
jgi:hypothetical protein